uniref:Uncharacterized protein n=1 Tax=Timema bartmani TaxID=61472 RepID=A0A7R9HX26_9NEOP|nr:unnamed protein product [Timema bartmani]
MTPTEDKIIMVLASMVKSCCITRSDAMYMNIPTITHMMATEPKAPSTSEITRNQNNNNRCNVQAANKKNAFVFNCGSAAIPAPPVEVVKAKGLQRASNWVRDRDHVHCSHVKPSSPPSHEFEALGQEPEYERTGAPHTHGRRQGWIGKLGDIPIYGVKISLLVKLELGFGICTKSW